MMSTWFRLAACAAFLALIGCSRGSGLPLEDVRGTVTKGGTPVEGVTLEFRPTTGRTSFGRTDASGRYALQYTDDISGAMIGEHTVQIRVPNPLPSQIPGFAEMDKEERMMALKYDAVRWPNAVSVTEGKPNVVDFELNEAGK